MYDDDARSGGGGGSAERLRRSSTAVAPAILHTGTWCRPLVDPPSAPRPSGTAGYPLRVSQHDRQPAARSSAYLTTYLPTYLPTYRVPRTSSAGMNREPSAPDEFVAIVSTESPADQARRDSSTVSATPETDPGVAAASSDHCHAGGWQDLERSGQTYPTEYEQRHERAVGVSQLARHVRRMSGQSIVGLRRRGADVRNPQISGWPALRHRPRNLTLLVRLGR
jgi:hypothetical protein